MRIALPSFPRSVALLSLSACAVGVLAGCGTDDVSFPTRDRTATATATADPSSDVAPVTTPLPSTTTVTAVVPASGGGGGTGGSDSDGTGNSGCAPNIGTAAAAVRDAPRIPQPGGNGSWHAYNAGGAWCRGLSRIELDRAGALAPVREHQILIYHDGHFQGTGIRCEARWGQYVLATSPDAITVQYTYIDLTNPAQQHSQGGVGKVDVTFRWNGSHVVMDGTLPYAFTEGKC